MMAFLFEITGYTIAFALLLWGIRHEDKLLAFEDGLIWRFKAWRKEKIRL